MSLVFSSNLLVISNNCFYHTKAVLETDQIDDNMALLNMDIPGLPPSPG